MQDFLIIHIMKKRFKEATDGTGTPFSYQAWLVLRHQPAWLHSHKQGRMPSSSHNHHLHPISYMTSGEKKMTTNVREKSSQTEEKNFQLEVLITQSPLKVWNHVYTLNFMITCSIFECSSHAAQNLVTCIDQQEGKCEGRCTYSLWWCLCLRQCWGFTEVCQSHTKTQLPACCQCVFVILYLCVFENYLKRQMLF